MNRRVASLAAGLSLILIVLTGCWTPAPKALYSEGLNWTLEAPGALVLDAETTNGSISISGWENETVTVDAWKEVRAYTEAEAEEFAREVKVQVQQEGDTIRVFKEHRKPPKGINVSVRYEIQAPKTIEPRLRTTNGSVRVYEIEAPISAQSTNGSVEPKMSNMV
ncbi:MAG: hypothetical protein ABIH23_01145, partial [bacterium]